MQNLISAVMKSSVSKFHTHLFSGESCGAQINYRVLKMCDSVFIYMGPKGSEAFDELALAMNIPSKGETISTSILGSSESRELAEKLTKRLNKQVYISANCSMDRINRPVIEKRLVEEISNHPEYF